MNHILRHFNCDLTDYSPECTLLWNRPREALQDGVGCWKRGDTHLSRRELALPPTVPLDAKVLAILISVPDQQLTSQPDHLAGSVEDLPVILEGHQVLLLIVSGTVHIPGVEARKGKETSGDESPPLLDHAQLLAFHL